MNIGAVHRVYGRRPLNRQTVRALNGTVLLRAIAGAAIEIGCSIDADRSG